MMKTALLAVLFLFSISHGAVKYNYDEVSEEIMTQDGRISGMKSRIGKDIVIGGLMYVHGSTNERCDTRTIGPTSIENLEAILYAIDVINSDPSILPNLTLGYDIRDTCGSENVGLDEAIDIIHSNGQIEIESCSTEFDNDTSSTETPVSAVIGAIISPVTISVAGLFRYFKIPQVCFSSTSTILNSRESYPYFFRTIPPDDQQVQAMIDLILHFQWDHISTLYSSNEYGQPAINAFHKLANKKGICLDVSESLDDDFEEKDYNEVARKLFYNSEARVVVLFASLHNVRGVLNALLRINDTSRKFLWLASDSWSEIDDYDSITIGKWGTAPSSSHVLGFDHYYSKLTPSSNRRNPWFEQYYYQYYYNCSNGTTGDCTRGITEYANYVQDSFDALAIDAVYTIASAFDAFFKENCNFPLVWYPQNRSCIRNNSKYSILTGENLKDYIQRTNFTSSTQNTINFDSESNIEGKYKILNLQRPKNTSTCNDKCKGIVHVGTWDGSLSSNRLKLFSNVEQQFGIDKAGNIITSLPSNCQSCSPGYVKRSVTSSCCGTCDPCLGSNYTNTSSSTMCMTCPDNMWGNNPLTGNTHCIDIDESYLKPSDAWGIVLIILAIIGLIAVVFVTSVFIWFWNTPIVKSSGREQMIMLLIGFTLCFFITIFFLLKPSPAACGLQRIGIWVSYSLILCSLLVKLIRIARIFMQKTVSSRPRFIAPHYQIGFTLILMCFPVLIVIISLIVAPPEANRAVQYNEVNHNSDPELIVTCSSPHIAFIVLQMVYFSGLLIASNALAVMTIRFPINFNEAKYVAFATFSLVLTWFFFILAFIVSQNTPYQGAALSTTIQVSAVAVLLCLFGPKMFVMIAWPTTNIKENTTASTTIKRSTLNSAAVMLSTINNNDYAKTINEEQ